MNLKPETIVEDLKLSIQKSILLDEDADDKSWSNQKGIIISRSEAEQIILALEGYHKTEWVSVGDRLPAKNGPCYVWDNGPYEAGFYNGKFKTLEKCVSGVLSDFRADINPTHWMPLPPAPNTKP